MGLDDGRENKLMGKVIKKLKNNDENPIYVANNNPSYDTSTYQVEYPEGISEEVMSNVITENMMF